MAKQRIDVHTHLIPPFWAEELKSHGGDPSGWGAPDWSPEQLLKFMDDEEIAVSVLSLTAPGIEGWEGAARLDIARRVNDYGAQLDARTSLTGLATSVRLRSRMLTRHCRKLRDRWMSFTWMESRYTATTTQSICRIRVSIPSGRNSNGVPRQSSSIQPGPLGCLYC